MTKTFFIFLMTSGTVILGQVDKIKIQKEKPTQDKITSIVTLAGLYNGNCSIVNILTEKQLKISNNTTGLKIISFMACVTNRGTLKCYAHGRDTLSKDIKTELLRLNFPEKPKLYIDEIKAVNTNNDTVLLNPIILVLTK